MAAYRITAATRKGVGRKIPGGRGNGKSKTEKQHY